MKKLFLTLALCGMAVAAYSSSKLAITKPCAQAGHWYGIVRFTKVPPGNKLVRHVFEMTVSTNYTMSGTQWDFEGNVISTFTGDVKAGVLRATNSTLTAKAVGTFQPGGVIAGSAVDSQWNCRSIWTAWRENP